MSELEKSLQAILKDKPFPARASSAIDEVTELLAKPEYQAAGEGSARKGIQGVLDDFVAKFKTGGEFAQRPMSLSDANIEKRGLYKAAKKAYDVVGSEMAPSRKEAQKALARGLRKSIEEAEPAVKPLNKELGLYGQLDNLMDDKIAKGALNNLMKFGMSDIAYGGAPAMMGSPEMGLVALALKKLLGTTLGSSLAGVGLGGYAGPSISKAGQGARAIGPIVSSMRD